MIITILKNRQQEVIIFLLSIVIATTIILISHSVLQSSINNKDIQNNTLNDIKNKYYTAVERKILLEKFQSKYNELVNAGIAGEENRLSWVDTIETIVKQNKIPYMKYKIDQQSKLGSVELASLYPDIDVFKSTMTLEMQLLHEGDLYTVINDLKKSARGLFDIQSCKIAKNNLQELSLLERGVDTNFASVCILNWYTMQTKSVNLPTRTRRPTDA